MQKYSYIPVLLLSLIIGSSSCGGHEENTPELKQETVKVVVAEASTGERKAVMASGQVESTQSAQISTRIMGRITSISVKVGDHVNAGQVLATISDEDITAKRAQVDAMYAEAEAALAVATKDRDRFQKLFDQQSATAKEFENVDMQFKSAKARVEAAKQMRNEVSATLSYSRLTAPFAGVVTQKLAEAGSLANPGMPLLVVERSGILQVSASVSEADIAKVHLGDSAEVLVKSTGKHFVGKVVQLNPSSQFTGGQYLVKISVPAIVANDVYAGMFVSAEIHGAGQQTDMNTTLTIPESALVKRDELTGLYTMSSDGKAMLRWLRLGRSAGGQVEVLSGLVPGERFIVSAEGRLYNGAPVVAAGH